MILRSILLTSGLSIFCGSTYGQPNNTPGIEAFQKLEDQYLTDIRCKTNVEAALSGKGLGGNKFATTREWTKMATRGNDGSTSLLSPTTIPGIWTKVRVYMNKEVEITQMTPNHTRTITFDVDRRDASLDVCKKHKLVKKATRRFDKEQMDKSFTDRDFIKLLKKNKSGVVYIWSPAMPYSYASNVPANGIELIKKAVSEVQQELGQDIALDYAVDPNSDPSYIKEIINLEDQMDMSMAKPVQSLELFFRMMHHHYPSVIVYSNGKIARFMYPGVESAAQYANYIKQQLNLLRR